MNKNKSIINISRDRPIPMESVSDSNIKFDIIRDNINTLWERQKTLLNANAPASASASVTNISGGTTVVNNTVSAKHFHGYSDHSGITITDTPTDIPFETAIFKDSSFAHTANDSEIEILLTKKYEISFEIGTSLDDNTEIEVVLLQDNVGESFTEIDASKGYLSHGVGTNDFPEDQIQNISLEADFVTEKSLNDWALALDTKRLLHHSSTLEEIDFGVSDDSLQALLDKENSFTQNQLITEDFKLWFNDSSNSIGYDNLSTTFSILAGDKLSVITGGDIDINTSASLAFGVSGSITLNGSVINVNSLLNIKASDVDTAYLKLIPGIDPLLPETGWIWLTASGLFAHVNGTTKQLDIDAPTGMIYADGSVDFTASQSLGGYNLTDVGGILSNDSLVFGIDEDNNTTTQSFKWRSNGSNVLMFIDELGSVGIGTESPTAGYVHLQEKHLKIINTTDTAVLTIDGNDTAQINMIDSYIRYDDGSREFHIVIPDPLSDVEFKVSVGSFNPILYKELLLTLSSPTDLIFNIDVDNTDTNKFIWKSNNSTELMTLTDYTGGRLGIGTDTPSTKVHIRNADASSGGPQTGTLLTLENDTNAYISFIAPSGSDTGLYLNDGSYLLTTNVGFNSLSMYSPEYLSISTHTEHGVSGGISISSVSISLNGPVYLKTPTANFASLLFPVGVAPTGDDISEGQMYHTSSGLYFNHSGTIYNLVADPLLSNGSMVFGIDEDNNSTPHEFVWRNNGSSELMRLNDSGILGIGTNSPDASSKLDVNGIIKGSSLLLPHGDTPSTYINGLIWTETSGAYIRVQSATRQLDVMKLSEVSGWSETTSDQTFNIKSETEFRIQDNIGETPANLLTISETLITLSRDTTINGDVIISGGSVSITSSGEDLELIGDNQNISLQALSTSSSIYLQASDSVVIEGKLELDASTTAKASVNNPHGVAPTTPTNGDEWTTTLGSYTRINGVTRKTDVMTLADVSAESLTAASQTFIAKAGEDFRIKNPDNTTYFSLVDDDITLLANAGISLSTPESEGFCSITISVPGSSGDITLSCSQSLFLTANDNISLSTDYVYLSQPNTPIVWRQGGTNAEGDWQLIPVGNNMAMQRFESDVWVTKTTFTA